MNLQARKCPRCESTFSPKREHAVYCSRTCGDYARQQKRRKALKKKYGTVRPPKPT